MNRKRKNNIIMTMVCWTFLMLIILSCDMAIQSYLHKESISPVAASIGQPITVTVHVGEIPNKTATGTVTIDGDTRCSFVLENARGSCQVVFYTVGDHTISINYSGDENFSTEYISQSYTVVAPGVPTPVIRTEVSIQSHLPAPSNPGEAVEFTVQVFATDGSEPTGTVTLSSDGETGCTADLTSGIGKCMLIFTTPGEKAVTASYPTTGTWVGSIISITHAVSYTTQISISLDKPSPTAGQNVQVTAIVSTVNNDAIPVGDLLIEYGIDASPCATLVDGSGACVIRFPTSGQYTIRIMYTPVDDGGNSSPANFQPSEASLGITVREAVILPPPEPTQEVSSGGGLGCSIWDEGSQIFACIVPCPDPSVYVETCTVP